MPRRFKLHCSYSYIVVTLQLHIVKNGEFKEEDFNQWKAVTEVESGTKPLRLAEKFGVPGNATWLLPGSKEKLKELSNLEYN